MKLRGLGLIAVAVLLCGSTAESQGVKAGDRVRLTGAFPDSPATGSVLEAGPDALVVRGDHRGRPVTVSLASVERLDVALGKRRQTVEGLALGVVGGALAGAVIGTPVTDRKTSAALGGLFGAALGALLGQAFETDRWQPVDFGPRVKVGLVPGPGIGAGLRVSF